MKKLSILLAMTLAFAFACNDNPETKNNDVADTGTSDADDVSDAGESDSETDTEDDAASDAEEDTTDNDAGASDCLEVTTTDSWEISFADGASTEYWADTTPGIEGETRKLSVLFERYGNREYVGTFELGPGSVNENFGDCAHCLFIRGDARERAFFADRGTIVSNVDPYSRNLDITVTNLRLIEVTVGEARVSTPVEDGVCIEVADFSVQGTFPPASWTCMTGQFDDGEFCNCECGAVDPDCNSQTADCLPGSPGCDSEPQDLPVVGCEAEEICQFEPISQGTECVATCDWANKTGCSETTTCVFDFGPFDSDVCLTGQERIFPNVELGENCPDNTGLQGVCNVVDGFAEGYCGPNYVCRPLCTDDAECTVSGETCRKFEDPNGLGYCGPVPTDG